MTGSQQGIRMRFAVLLPTEGFDYERSSLKALYEKVNDFPDLGLDELRHACGNCRAAHEHGRRRRR